MSDGFELEGAARKARPTHLVGQLNRQGVLVGLLFVLVVTVAVRLSEPTGWLGSDDAAYYSAAEHILTGTTITRAHHHYARMAIIVPVAASVAVFGHHTWAVALPMFAASVACVFLVVALGKLLFGWREGLLAGLIVSVLPYFRVLSTTAYADTHVCFWVTAATLCCTLALRAAGAKRRSVLFAACGFALGLAISSKVFAATTLCAIFALVAHAEWKAGRRIGAAGLAVVVGGLCFVLAEGLFYSHFANDFFFSLHAHEQSQAGVPAIAGESSAAGMGAAQLIWDRITLLMHPSTSGWGWVGVAFWPAVILSFWFGGAARAMAWWAGGTYLLIAFAPVSLAGGYQPYPLFHGRHILPACIPFALCLAYIVARFVGRLEAAQCASVPISLIWPALGVLVGVLSLANPNALRGFRDRPTGRMGDAISEIIAAIDWRPGVPIYLTPSSYWRYRLLFPEHLRAQLRVAASDDAPRWWFNVTPDIAAREGKLTSSEKGYLLATPEQLAGGAESWDYGVGLPEELLNLWGRRTPLVVVSRGPDRKLSIAANTQFESESVAVLLGLQPPQSIQAAKLSTELRGRH